ncbi:hypothetical protein GOV10_03190, partial [Candidatus Woesearchaeota archaeon]|nr:hypothetical protein [Candidatus Woesearchaeota archaeon]
MHSDDYNPFEQSAIVAVDSFPPETLEAVEQFKKDYGAVSKLLPQYADMIDELGTRNAIITIAEFVDLLSYDEHEFMQQVKLLTPRNPLAKDEHTEKAMGLLSEYD